MTTIADSGPARGPLPLVAVGFGTSVAMWIVGYVCRLAPDVMPGAILMAGMLAALVVGGVLLGRHSACSWRGAAGAGAISATVNLLILGSLVGKGDGNAVVPSALIWLPGSYVASMALLVLGHVVGRRLGAADWSSSAWRTAFMLVATAATGLVVIAGGVVTSHEAGLAVPDWPNSFGSNMFLYPLSRMTGGIYYEHAHRLAGALVGLTTIALAVVIFRTDDRRWLRNLALIAVAFVIVQGIMGGLRVTGSFTLAEQPDTAPELRFAVVHGVTGQLFLAFIALFVAFTSRTWRTTQRLDGEPGPDRGLTTTLVVLAVLQLTLGAMYRHYQTPEVPLPWPSMAHFTLAFGVLIVAVLVGLRAWAGGPPLRAWLGKALLVVVSIQLLLGFGALVPILADRADWRTIEVTLATAHQANGALFLVLCVLAAAWTRRLEPRVMGRVVAA